MKYFKLKGLDIYVKAYGKEGAVMCCLMARIGVTENDLEEVSEIPENVRVITQ